jgi:hypothetical protein
LGLDFHAANGKAQHAPMMGPVFSFWVWGGVGGFIFGFLFMYGRDRGSEFCACNAKHWHRIKTEFVIQSLLKK